MMSFFVLVGKNKMIDLWVGSMSKDELNLPEGLKMSLISRHTLNIFKNKISASARFTSIVN